MGFMTKIWESVFNTHAYDTPVHTVRPVHERPTRRPIMRPTSRPPLGAQAHWTSQPPDIKTEPPLDPSDAVAARESALAFSMKNVLWVFLSGCGVIVLIAIFMKLGGPIRRVRRQLSHGRPAQNDVITATLRPHDANSATASLLGSSADLPPPYSTCVRHEEPPPRFSACFTNPKHAEPQVHIRRQNDLIENGLRVESVPLNNSRSVTPGMRTELVLDNGRIVERLK